MQIVPGHDSLAVEIKIAPQDIDQLHFRQAAVVKF
jgi:hypothetical protein